MEREIGVEDRNRLNLKQGRGGLVDVEFLTQLMALRYGKKIPALRCRGTIGLIRALAESGLMERTVAADLEGGYFFLLRLENRLRIETDQAAWAVPTDPLQLTPLARRMGYAGAGAARQLIEDLERRRTRIRATFDAVLAREREAAAD